jgi:hypothetical protein
VHLRHVPTKAASAGQSKAADLASMLVGRVRLFQPKRFSCLRQFENLITMGCPATFLIRWDLPRKVGLRGEGTGLEGFFVKLAALEAEVVARHGRKELIIRH